MAVRVFSEIAPLRRVLVHAPGAEVDTMLPERMEGLLFDDLLHGPTSRVEHARFRGLLAALGAEVLETRDLLREALVAAPRAIPELLADVARVEGIPPGVAEELRAMRPASLAAALVEGVPSSVDDPLRREAPAPLPNLMFSRDAGFVLGDRVAFARMWAPARRREPVLLRFVFRHHPALAPTPVLRDFLADTAVPGAVVPSIEGGDVLVLDGGVVLIGVSQRTMEGAADRLVEALRGDERFRAVVLVLLPAARSAMHLDTVFTQLSEHECLVYAPLVCEGTHDTASAVVIDLRIPDDGGRRHPTLLGALRSLGVDLEPRWCGGRTSYVQQAREQWTDGANCLALRPGVIALYERNVGTADELARAGYDVVPLASLPGDADGIAATLPPGRKAVILIEGRELSRARGGPRCLTMPLERAG